MKTLLIHLVTLTSALILLTAPLAASDLEDRISIDLEGAPALIVLNSFGDVLEAGVVVDPGLGGTISIRLDNVRVRTVLDAVCDSLGCTWELDVTSEDRTISFGPGETVPEPEAQAARLAEKINISFLEAPAVDVMSSFATILRSDLDVECELAGKLVTIDLHEVTLGDAIDQLCDEVGCVCLVEPGSLKIR